MDRGHSFWEGFMEGVEAVPINTTEIRGASGIDHPLLAAGHDETRKRLVVASREHDARDAALVQADLQMARPDLQVIVVRPVLVSVGRVLSPAEVDGIQERAVREKLENHLDDMNDRARAVFSDDEDISAWLDLHLAQFRRLLALTILRGHDVSDEEFCNQLRMAAATDPLEHDRNFGVCGVPLYDFSENEIALVRGDNGSFLAKETLRLKGIHQYFFPPPDQLALGIIERAQPKDGTQLCELVQQAPALGHPFGCPELLPGAPQGVSIVDLVEYLQDRHLAVSGEVSMKVGPEGKTIRQSVRFKPREGVISKLLNRCKFEFNLKDLFRGGNPG